MANLFPACLSSDDMPPYLRKWLSIQSRLGRASATIYAYGRTILSYINFCKSNGIDYENARREHIVNYIHYLSTKHILLKISKIQPGLSNATMQQHIVAIRLYYEFLKEEGVYEDTLITRGKYTKYNGFGVGRIGLLPHYKNLPWIPNEDQVKPVAGVLTANPVDGLVKGRL
jgi:integrase/recombinase XerD